MTTCDGYTRKPLPSANAVTTTDACDEGVLAPVTSQTYPKGKNL